MVPDPQVGSLTDVAALVCALVVLLGFAPRAGTFEVRYLAPNDFTFWKSIEILIMVVTVVLMAALAGNADVRSKDQLDDFIEALDGEAARLRVPEVCVDLRELRL